MRTFLTVLIVILVIALILAVAAFFLLQDHIYYTADGKAHVDLPFFQDQNVEPSAPPPVVSREVVVSTQPTQTPEPSQEPALTPVALPLSALTDGSAAERVEAAGGNAALFDMKGVDGMLGYVSQLPLAVDMGVSAAQSGLNEAIRTLNETEGLYTVARVSCFRDNRAPRHRNAMALRSATGNWMDGESRWLNVAVAETRTYVAQVCGELAALGFDEILLENAGYPVSGNVANIKVGETYDPEDLSGPVDAFYEEVARVLEEYPEVKLSIAARAEALAGEDALSGQTLEQLGKYAQRVYLPGPKDEAAAREYDRALGSVGLSGADVVYTTPGYEPQGDEAFPVGGKVLEE